MSDMWVVVGLGNPGEKYSATRHNVGQMVLAQLAQQAGASFRAHSSGLAMVAEGWLRAGGPKLVFARSTGYMNTSGGPVKAVLKYFKVPPERLIVLHDELDLPAERVRLKSGGGHGGHNGLRSIIQSLGTADFARVRIGIGRPPSERVDTADWVLAPFSRVEREHLPSVIDRACEAVELTVDHGLLVAQNRLHALN